MCEAKSLSARRPMAKSEGSPMSKRETDRGQAEEIDRDIPPGGEAVTAGSVAQHTPEGLKEARDEEPLLDDNEDIPLGGEGVLRGTAEHTPERYTRPGSEEP